MKKKWTDFKTLSIFSLSLLSKNVFTQNFDKRIGFLKANTFLCNTHEGEDYFYILMYVAQVMCLNKRFRI